MPVNDGGPAFPGEQGNIPAGTWNQTWCGGMSLRDWFAGQALTAYKLADMSSAEAAKYAYADADAMLKARESA